MWIRNLLSDLFSGLLQNFVANTLNFPFGMSESRLLLKSTVISNRGLNTRFKDNKLTQIHNS